MDDWKKYAAVFGFVGLFVILGSLPSTNTFYLGYALGVLTSALGAVLLAAVLRDRLMGWIAKRHMRNLRRGS